MVYAVLVGSSLYLEVKVVFSLSRNYRGIPAKGAGLMHNLARTLLPLDLREYRFISQRALAHP